MTRGQRYRRLTKFFGLVLLLLTIAVELYYLSNNIIYLSIPVLVIFLCGFITFGLSRNKTIDWSRFD